MSSSILSSFVFDANASSQRPHLPNVIGQRQGVSSFALQVGVAAPHGMLDGGRIPFEPVRCLHSFPSTTLIPHLSISLQCTRNTVGVACAKIAGKSSEFLVVFHQPTSLCSIEKLFSLPLQLIFELFFVSLTPAPRTHPKRFPSRTVQAASLSAHSLA